MHAFYNAPGGAESGDQRALRQCIQSCRESAIWRIDEGRGWLQPTGSIRVGYISGWNRQPHNGCGAHGRRERRDEADAGGGG